MPSPIVPSSQQPIADPSTGMVTTFWQRFFNALVSAPGPIVSVTVDPSPFMYTAGAPGTLVISGGTISAVDLSRNTASISLGTSRSISMANGDGVTITYSVMPTVSFIPA